MYDNEIQDAALDAPGESGQPEEAGQYAPAGADGFPGGPEVRSEGDGPAAPAEDAADAGGDAERLQLRRRILRRFEAYLDEVLADEEPPQGLDAEILAELQSEPPAGAEGAAGLSDDLASLWSAMTAVAQETKLQGRAFKQLHESLSALEDLPDSVRGVLSAHGEALAAAREAAAAADDLRQEQVRQAAEAAQEEMEAKLLNVLLDVRDRLVRGADTARRQLAAPRARRPAWPERLIGWLLGRAAADPGPSPAVAAAEAMLEGCTLSLSRLDEALASLGVSEIPCAGRPFDPQSMMATAVERTAEVPEGTVLEVYRSGYQRRGRVHRLAEVKVARQPARTTPAAAGQENKEHERA